MNSLLSSDFEIAHLEIVVGETPETISGVQLFRDDNFIVLALITGFSFDGLSILRAGVFQEEGPSENNIFFDAVVRHNLKDIPDKYRLKLERWDISHVCAYCHQHDLPVSIQSYSDEEFLVGKIAEINRDGVRFTFVEPNGDVGTTKGVIAFEEIDCIDMFSSYEEGIVSYRLGNGR